MNESDLRRPATRKEEAGAFLALTFVLAPSITIGGIGLFGLAIWLAQTFFTGPPSG